MGTGGAPSGLCHPHRRYAAQRLCRLAAPLPCRDDAAAAARRRDLLQPQMAGAERAASGPAGHCRGISGAPGDHLAPLRRDQFQPGLFPAELRGDLSDREKELHPRAEGERAGIGLAHQPEDRQPAPRPVSAGPFAELPAGGGSGASARSLHRQRHHGGGGRGARPRLGRDRCLGKLSRHGSHPHRRRPARRSDPDSKNPRRGWRGV